MNILNVQKSERKPRAFSQYSKLSHASIKWMLFSGYADDGFSSKYDEVMDLCAILLVKVYKDKTALPVIMEMIFNRYKKELLMYDLVWAFFECRDIDCLRMVASRLCSPYWKDVELSRKLLRFAPCIGENRDTDGIKQYYSFLGWFEENRTFLYYTGESFQQTSKPMFYNISHQARYLCKPVSASDGKILPPLTEYEKRLLDNFNGLEESIRIKLSSCSHRMYRQNPYKWALWLHYPVTEQLRTARLMEGEFYA